MTEDEARKCWCPMHRVSASPAGDLYGNMPNYEANTCAASLCMAWRWATNPESIHRVPPKSTTHGYCGLAGQP